VNKRKKMDDSAFPCSGIKSIRIPCNVQKIGVNYSCVRAISMVANSAISNRDQLKTESQFNLTRQSQQQLPFDNATLLTQY
jgi:hypothetical protein